jgi:hypothetical protein
MDSDKSNPLCSCPKEGAWSHRERAVERLGEIQALHVNSGPEVKVPTRVYQCRYGIWHLTSMPLATDEREV